HEVDVPGRRTLSGHGPGGRRGGQVELGHQSTTPPALSCDGCSPNNPSRIRRTIGVAVVAPWPPCSTMHTTTYRGWFAGAMAANHENGCFPAMSAVPVFPATGIWDRGKPENAAEAVPLTGTPVR